MTVKNRMEKQPPAVNWHALPLLLDEIEAADALGVSVSFLRKSRCDEVDPFVKTQNRCFLREVF